MASFQYEECLGLVLHVAPMYHLLLAMYSSVCTLLTGLILNLTSLL